MTTKEIFFSINRYDRDGDLVEQGVFLHFGETIVKASDSVDDFCSNIVDDMQTIVREIKEHYC